MKAKTIAYSRTKMSQVMLPGQANPAGNVHGGEIMKMMDTTASVVALKHCRKNVVTARVDELQFHMPIFVGALVTCKAELVFVGRTSMEIYVVVEFEDLQSDEGPKVALTAFFTMVALDSEGKPTPVPALITESKEEEEAFEAGRKRYEKYKARRAEKC